MAVMIPIFINMLISDANVRIFIGVIRIFALEYNKRDP
jgi:hypothetical protein